MTGTALFGGAFNPPHETHRKVIRAALEQLPIDELIVIPTGGHPFKQDGQLAPAQARLELCRAAFLGRAELPGVEVSTHETDKDGLCYTVDTLAALKNDNPDRELFWIVGSDNLRDLHKWRQPHAILQLANLVVYPRAGFPIEVDALAGLDLPVAEKVRLLQQQILLDEPDDVSATAIRDALSKGQQPEHLDPEVHRRILGLGLYGTGGPTV